MKKKSTILYILLTGTLFFFSCNYDQFNEIPTEVENNTNERRLIYFDNFDQNELINLGSQNNIITILQGFTSELKPNQNQVLKCDNEGVLILEGLSLNTLDSISINLWIKSFAYNNEFLIQQGQINDSLSNRIKIANSRISFGNPNFNNSQPLSTNIFDNEWKMITITSASINQVGIGNGYKVYVNGDLITVSTTSNIAFEPNNLWRLFEEMDAEIDKFAIYDYELNQDEIASLYTEEQEAFDIGVVSALSSGLVSYYNFDDESMSDSLDNKNGISIVNLTYSDDTPNGMGKALDLSGGINENMIIEQGHLDNYNQISISFWLNTNRTEYQPLFIQGPNVYEGTHLIATNTSTVTQNSSIYFGDAKYCFNCTGKTIPYFDGQWHHIALVGESINTSNGGKMSLYFDGVLNESSPDSNIDFLKNMPLLIGTDSETNSHCKLDNIRIYNRSLSAEEVLAIYNLETN